MAIWKKAVIWVNSKNCIILVVLKRLHTEKNVHRFAIKAIRGELFGEKERERNSKREK